MNKTNQELEDTTKKIGREIFVITEKGSLSFEIDERLTRYNCTINPENSECVTISKNRSFAEVAENYFKNELKINPIGIDFILQIAYSDAHFIVDRNFLGQKTNILMVINNTIYRRN